GLVADEPAGLHLVDVLPARAAAAAAELLDVLGVDLDLYVRQLGQDGDRGGAGVDAPLRLGLGDALDAVPAALEAEVAVGAVALDVDDDLLEAAALRRGEIVDVEPPAVALGVALVHIEQVAGNDAG